MGGSVSGERLEHVMVRAIFRTRADFAAPASKQLLMDFAEKAADVAAGPVQQKANAAFAIMRSELQSAPKSNNWQVQDAQRVSSYLRILPTRQFSRAKVAPGTRIPVALISSPSRSSWRWEYGDKNMPATYFFTKGINSVRR